MGLEDMVASYIVTAAQRGALINRPFLRSLENYANRHGSEIVVVPMDGSHRDDRLHPDLNKYTVANEMPFSDKFGLLDMPVKPQQIRPLTGLGAFVQHGESAVVGAPKQHLEAVPVSNHKLPKVLTTTGAVTHPNYNTANRIGSIAEKDHTYGALVVEVSDDDSFQYRHVQATTDGSFVDLGVRYFQNDKIAKSRPEALVLGDWHTGQTNDDVRTETYRMITELKPRYLVVHDVFDGMSVNHHEQNSLITRGRRTTEGKTNLEEELLAVGEELTQLLNRMPRDGKVYVVKSNHDEFLNRYLEEGRFSGDPENIRLSSAIAVDYFDGHDPLVSGIEHTYGKLSPRIIFLERDDDLKVRGWQLGAHGDLGGNGSRGTITQQAKNYGKSIVGHRHTPHIRRDAWCVGTSTDLKLDYNKGPSSWMNTHGLVYPNGKAQLVNIIDGQYRFS